MTEWKTGDVITAERLNDMTPNLFIVKCTKNSNNNPTYSIDKTVKEIADASSVGAVGFLLDDVPNYTGNVLYIPKNITIDTDTTTFGFKSFNIIGIQRPENTFEIEWVMSSFYNEQLYFSPQIFTVGVSSISQKN